MSTEPENAAQDQAPVAPEPTPEQAPVSEPTPIPEPGPTPNVAEQAPDTGPTPEQVPVAEPTSETTPAPEQAPEFTFDPSTEVFINDTQTAKYNKSDLSDLINKSSIFTEHKSKILSQIEDGQISPQYQDTIQSVLVANSQGSIFTPGTIGY